MKKYLFIAALCLTGCGSVFSIPESFPDQCRWVDLVRVVDGDTIIVNESERVRFIGIDSPEMKHPKKPVQPYSLESARELKRLLRNQSQVCLLSDPAGDEKDIYERTLAYIFRKDGLDVNAEMLKRGAARAYLWFEFSRKEEFKNLADQARSEDQGLWSQP